MAVFSSFFVSCEENGDYEDLNKCEITVSCTDGGKVEISKYLETSVSVLIGSQIEVVATPDDGYAFTGWYVDDSTEPVSTDAVFTFVATKNTTLTAHFTKLLNLSVCSSGNGSVSFKGTAETTNVALLGSTITVVATPDENYDFVGWFVDDEEIPVSTDEEYSFIVTGDITLTAKFEFEIEAVDLGLPSGIKWAACNVGATKPEEYGVYYAWGETEEKEYYGWDTYKWCNGSSDTMTKYCTSSSYGTVDNKTVLDLEDDVAHVKWGGTWRMPTKAEREELLDNCIWSWTTQNGVNGYKVTSKTNGNSIFLPAAGCRYGAELNGRGVYGDYWSRSSDTGGNYFQYAYALDYFGGIPGMSFCYRSKGLCVRPVSK